MRQALIWEELSREIKAYWAVGNAFDPGDPKEKTKLLIKIVYKCGYLNRMDVLTSVINHVPQQLMHFFCDGRAKALEELGE